VDDTRGVWDWKTPTEDLPPGSNVTIVWYYEKNRVLNDYFFEVQFCTLQNSAGRRKRPKMLEIYTARKEVG